MRTILKSADFKDLVIVKEFPDQFGRQNDLLETIYQTDMEGFDGQTREILLNGICIEHRNIHHDKALQIEVQHDFPFFKMHFELKGYSNFESGSKGSKNVTITEGCHQLFFFPEVKGKLQYTAQRRYTLEIKLTMDFLNKIMGEDLSLLGALGVGLLDSQPVMIGGKSLPILPAMRQVIHDILHCPFHALMKKVYLEAKVTELLIMQLSQFDQQQADEPSRSVLRSGDAERILFVKQLIEDNIQEPCTLLELAGKAGLNDFKLKKGFKEMFGNTVFGYMSHVRMDRAKTLLLEGQHSIAEVSFLVGYKNPQHFTAAFKKSFGYLPSELKN